MVFSVVLVALVGLVVSVVLVASVVLVVSVVLVPLGVMPSPLVVAPIKDNKLVLPGLLVVGVVTVVLADLVVLVALLDLVVLVVLVALGLVILAAESIPVVLVDSKVNSVSLARLATQQLALVGLAVLVGQMVWLGLWELKA